MAAPHMMALKENNARIQDDKQASAGMLAAYLQTHRQLLDPFGALIPEGTKTAPAPVEQRQVAQPSQMRMQVCHCAEWRQPFWLKVVILDSFDTSLIVELSLD